MLYYVPIMCIVRAITLLDYKWLQRCIFIVIYIADPIALWVTIYVYISVCKIKYLRVRFDFLRESYILSHRN